MRWNVLASMATKFVVLLAHLNVLVISQDLGCVNSGCYQLTGNASTLVDAQRLCHENGLLLAKGQGETVMELLSDESSDFAKYNIGTYWLDIRSSVLPSFQYLNGKNFGRDPPGWPRSQPITGETCGVVVMENQKPTLKKAHCGLLLGFICYLVKDDSGGNIRLTLYFSIPMNWFEARAFCLRRGEDLYDGPLDRIYEFNPIRQLWIGLRKHKLQYRDSSKDVIYTRWQSGSPDNLGVGCTVASNLGRWKMADCSGNQIRSVICYEPGLKITRSAYSGAIAGFVIGLLMSLVLVFFAIKGYVGNRKEFPPPRNVRPQQNLAFVLPPNERNMHPSVC